MENIWEEEKASFIAGEIGGAVVELVVAGTLINKEAIIERLERKCRTVGNSVHKGILRDAAELVRRGN